MIKSSSLPLQNRFCTAAVPFTSLEQDDFPHWMPYQPSCLPAVRWHALLLGACPQICLSCTPLLRSPPRGRLCDRAFPPTTKCSEGGFGDRSWPTDGFAVCGDARDGALSQRGFSFSFALIFVFCQHAGHWPVWLRLPQRTHFWR